MREVNEILPTEGLLLLNVKETTGEQLLVKTIEELLLLEVIQIRSKFIEGKRISIIRELLTSNQYLKDYHNIFLQSIKEHYNAYNEITIRNALTPHKLIGSVRHKLGFNDNTYKFDHIYERLKLWDLVRSKFPYYYINKSLTKRGQELKDGLKGMIEKLSRVIMMENKHELRELSEKLGYNIILIPGAFSQLGKMKFAKPKYFPGPELETQNFSLQLEILEQEGIGLPALEDFDD